jgi:hypothetical protein
MPSDGDFNNRPFMERCVEGGSTLVRLQLNKCVSE